jgi:hypothetical protein
MPTYLTATRLSGSREVKTLDNKEPVWERLTYSQSKICLQHIGNRKVRATRNNLYLSFQFLLRLYKENHKRPHKFAFHLLGCIRLCQRRSSDKRQATWYRGFPAEIPDVPFVQFKFYQLRSQQRNSLSSPIQTTADLHTISCYAQRLFSLECIRRLH